MKKQNNPAEVEWWLSELIKDENNEINSFPFVVFGTILLFVCWLFFNGGSTMNMFAARSNGAPKIMSASVIFVSRAVVEAPHLERPEAATSSAM